jgi:tRNA pseudouridine38-40 synthase
VNYYKLIVSYDGSAYFGWQWQDHGLTIQNIMTNEFLRVFKMPCQLLAASRTDAGVHALGQVVSLRTELNIDAARLLTVFNMALPDAIQVVSLVQVAKSYNPHANVIQKIYQYRIFTVKAGPMKARYGWLPAMPERIDWAKFVAALKVFVGRYNFTAFARIEADEEKEVMRSITDIECNWVTEHELLVTITGHSFLRYQIRRMIGAAFEVARKRQFTLQHLQHSLTTGEPLPAQITFNAPARGLCLVAIHYQD